MKLVKLNQMEAALAKLGYKLLGQEAPKPRKPLSPKAKKAISKAMKARWASKASKTGGRGPATP